MFTGIIQAVGKIEKVTRQASDLSLRIGVGALPMEDVALGDSIAVNGVCLTVVKLGDRSFEADVSVESLHYTGIGQYRPGTAVNLEKALTLSTPLGGHLVSGHVDGLGEIVGIQQEGRSTRYEIAAPEDIRRYIATKGSIAVDGVSLTVTALSERGFCLNIVPHTLGNTIIPQYRAGTKVHLEVDVIARYTERLLLGDKMKGDILQGDKNGPGQQNKGLDRSFLVAHGYTGRRT